MKKFDITTVDGNFAVFTMEEIGCYIPDIAKYGSFSIDTVTLKEIYTLIYSWLDKYQTDLQFINFHIVEGVGVFFVFKKLT